MMRRFGCALLLVLFGCPAGGTSSEWRILFAEPALGERAVAVRLQILQGGCDGDNVLYEEDVRRDAAATMPATLESGRHGFRATARDVTCTEFALDCREAEFPADAGTITLTLSAIMDRSLCGGDACVDGECGPCIEGRADCDGDESNGCEADLGTSGAHCGGCDQPCEGNNASATCVAGRCELGACNDGFDDCDMDPNNGCEADLGSVSHCGMCGRTCMGDAECNDGSCSLLECDPGTADCDEVPDNGCEVDTTSSAANCGTCGRSCGIGGTCQNGRCDDEMIDLIQPYVFFFLPTRAIMAGGRLVEFANVGGGRGAYRYLNVDDAVGLFSGTNFQCYLRASGELVCNNFNIDDARTLATDIAVMSSHHSDRLGTVEVCGVRRDGSAACWVNGNGEPRELEGRDYVEIESGAFVCGKRADGTLECMDGHQGAVDCDTPMEDSTPVAIEYPASATFSTGFANLCAIDDTGVLRCSGQNSAGQVGNRRTSMCELPTEVAPLSNAVDVDVTATGGAVGACAVTNDGELWCWGNLLAAADSNEPVRIGGINNAVQVDIAGACLGTLGRDGIFTQTDTCIGGGTQQSARGAIEVTAGDSHTCARRINGRVACWGLNLEGQLGDGTFDSRLVPTLVEAPNAIQIDAGARHTCIVSEDGEVWCWGDNSSGQLGRAGPNSNVPVRVPGSPGIKTIRAGGSSTCAVSVDDEVFCWGDNTMGQIVDGGPDIVETPTSLGTSTHVAVGANTICIRGTGSFMTCTGAYEDSFNAVTILGMEASDSGACSVAVVEFVCNGSIPDPETGEVTTVTEMGYTDDTFFSEVAIGEEHACSVTTDGSLRCWGNNDSGQLGVPPGETSRGVVDVDLPAVTTVAVGARHTCARTVSGEVHCFGSGTFGQLGDGTMTDRDAPVEAMEFR